MMTPARGKLGPDILASDPVNAERRRMEALAEELVGRKSLDHIESQLGVLRSAYTHPNRTLHYDDLLVCLLLGFYNPTVRSLRTLEGLSQTTCLQEHLSVDRICRSTTSDAMALFDPELLTPIIKELHAQVPGIEKADTPFADFVKKIVAGDGSYFSIYNDVAWALIHTKSNGRKQGQIRLNLQIDAITSEPLQASISGDDGSEPAAVKLHLLADAVYLLDRNFVDFELLKEIIRVGSDFVVRGRSNAPSFQAQRERELTEKDKEHGVVSDRIGILPGSGGDTPEPPDGLLREVVIAGSDGKPVRLLTTLLDLPAWMIGLLYRKRWQIELFFRWLKVWANFEHLICHNKNGLLIQFYVAVIGVLLMYVRLGRRISKYAYSLLTVVAAGGATLEEILPILERREHEKELERARLARKKAEKKNA
jgi:hypothetical protein